MRKPATATAMTKAAGRRMGLKIRKRGDVIAKPMTVPMKEIPARKRRKAPMGKRVRSANSLEVEREASGRMVLKGSVVGRS